MFVNPEAGSECPVAQQNLDSESVADRSKVPAPTQVLVFHTSQARHSATEEPFLNCGRVKAG